MIKNRSRKFGKFLRAGQLFGSALLVTACTVSAPLTVQSSGADAAAPNAQIAISVPDGEGQTVKSRFAAALIESLSSRGIAIGESGDLIADYGVSTGSAEIGVQSSHGGQDAPVWIASARPAKRFDECEAVVMRGSLLLLDRTTGTVVYRGTGAMTDCDFDDADLREMADGLVNDYTANFTSQ